MAPRRTARERELDALIDRFERMAGFVPDADVLDILSSDTAKVAAAKQATTLRAERARIRAVRLAQAAETEVDRLARLRTLAEHEGSWVAASKYAQTEAELRAQIALAEASRAASEMAGMESDELLELLRGAIEQMPMPWVQELSVAVHARLGPAAAWDTYTPTKG